MENDHQITDSLENLMTNAFRFIEERKLDEAENIFTQLLQQVPNYMPCLVGLGIANYLQGKESLAKNFFELVLAEDQNNKVSLEYLSSILFNEGLLEKSKECLHHLVHLDEKNPIYYRNLGLIAQRLDDFTSAQKYYLEALSLKKDYVDCLTKLGTLYNEHQLWEQSEFYYKKALSFSPNDISTLVNLGELYKNKGNFSESISIYNTALELCKNNKDYFKEESMCRLNLSIVQLLLKDFALGWENYQSRKIVFDKVINPPANAPVWDGVESLQNKEIQIVTEQGFGDYIQLIRFSQKFKEQGARVIALCPPEIESIIKTVPWVDEVHHEPIPSKENSYQAMIFDLPRCFHTDLSNIPHTVPYIFSDPEKVKSMRHYFNTKKHIKIGLAWLGNKTHRHDKIRSLSLKIFLPILKNKRIACYSLVVRDDQNELITFKNFITDTRHLIKDFSDTAAIIEHLDLVITVDSAVAHLAGAMNKPCWLLLQTVPDWRWHLKDAKSSWYPSLQLFRQTKEKDWSDVMKRIAKKLQTLPTTH